jgi:Xaa-Pro aminopeptidase
MIKADYLFVRQQKLKNLQAELNLDSFLLSTFSAKKYLIDVEIEGSFLLFRDEIPLLIFHKMFQENIDNNSSNFEKVVITQTFISYLKEQNILTGKVGIEEDFLTCSFIKSLKMIFPKVKFINISNKLSELIDVHDDESIKRFKKASIITKKVYLDILKEIKPGITEFDLAQEIIYLTKKHGGDREAFPPIIAFGKSSSQPHYEPKLKKLRNEKVILLDFGVMYKGVCTDISRTILLSENREIYNSYLLVKDALSEVEKLIKARIKVSDLDNLVRRIFSDKNLEENFIHALGHGIGYEVHQKPRISFQSSEILKENQIVSIEPALYFAGKFGIRIENNYLITKNGSLNLTNY